MRLHPDPEADSEQKRPRIATRGSLLARAQAHLVVSRLAQSHPDLRDPGIIEICIVKTTGDRLLNQAVSETGGKGAFTKEIDQALLSEKADIAVHSMKDVPVTLPSGIIIACLLAREDPRDILIGRTGLGDLNSLDDLPEGACVGTSSLRRRAQLLHRRSDLDIRPLRGNIDRRLEILAAGEMDAIVLALAGLRRLGLNPGDNQMPSLILDPEMMLPAPAQGTIGVACRAEDTATRQWLAPLNDPDTTTALNAERAFLTALGGDCRTPIAAWARLRDHRLTLQGLLATADGRTLWRAADTGNPHEATRLGHRVAARIKKQAGK